MSEVYKVVIVGTRPLLLHNPAGIGNFPKLRRGEHLPPEEEAKMYLYLDEQGRPCVPATNIKACIRDAGRNYRVRGRKCTFAAMIRAALMIQPQMVPIISRDGWKVDIRSVVVQRQRILRARPRFDDWKLEFEIWNSDPTIIPADMLHKILVDAGRYYGLGDFRPEFGLFEVKEFKPRSKE